MEPASWVILSNLLHRAGPQGASLNQLKMWLIPQKAEHENDYNINKGYFEMLLNQTLVELIEQGYVKSSLPGGVKDGDAQLFSLTEKGAKHAQELLESQAEQASAFDS